MLRPRLLLFAVVSVALMTSVAPAAAPAAKPASPPELYGFCMDLPAVPKPSIPDQVRLLKELGFDGVGYPLWFGEELQTNLRTLDDAGLPLHLVYTSINLDPGKPPFDPGVPQSLAALKGRPVTVSVLIGGFPPGDPRGVEPAVKILRELADLAAESGLKISIYHHVNNWTESLPFALEVVQKVDRPNLGVNFNLCHWLKVDGDKDYRTVLRENAPRIFAVTINGAQLDATAWTGGLIQPLDRGDFDNRQLLAVLKEIGYTGPVGLMCYGIPDNTREHLARSIKTWKSWQEP
ncbi:MAG: sugar phosphate isomerase/epimerase family protein [Thermoguttaceae bacterium]